MPQSVNTLLMLQSAGYFDKGKDMSNPTGDALMARVKELEEALEHVTELLVDTWDHDMCGGVEEELAVINARKALNGNQT